MRATRSSRVAMRTRFFGQYLLSQGLIAASQLLEAVEFQNKNNSRLGDLAVALGFVTSFDAERINALQSRQDLYFGEAAVQLGLMTKAQINELLATQKDAHVHLGEALVTLGHMQTEQLNGALAAFQKQEAEVLPEPSLPDTWLGRAMARRLWELTPRLLLRTWDLTSKVDGPQLETDHLLLSDLNVQMPLTAEYDATLLVGLPYAAAHRAAARFAGDGRPEEGALRDMVREFAHALSHQLTSVFAERGQRVTSGSASLCPGRVQVPAGALGLAVPHLTHVGKVIVGLIV